MHNRFIVAFHALASQLAEGMNARARTMISQSLAAFAVDKAALDNWSAARFEKACRDVFADLDAMTAGGGELGPRLSVNPPDPHLTGRVHSQADALVDRLSNYYPPEQEKAKAAQSEAAIIGALWGALMLDFQNEGRLTVDHAVELYKRTE